MEQTKPVTRVNRIGSHSFRMLKIDLAPRQMLIVETGAMASQDSQIEIETLMNGGFFSALLMRILGGESFFVNYFVNRTEVHRQFYLSQPTPGEIVERDLNNETIYLQAGAFIARTPGIKGRAVWAGLASWMTGEGLFRLELSGTGRLWYGSYGAVVEKEVVGDYIVDSGHLLSYPPNMKLSLRLVGSLFSSILSREGFVLRLSGNGKVQLQTRSIKGLASWLNPKFWG